jgi:non-lysosomal glucosylceramidase
MKNLFFLTLFKGMGDKAWLTLKGMYDLLYNKWGLAFQTPEALMKNNVFRSLGYMRALCIWSVIYSIDDLASSNNM